MRIRWTPAAAADLEQISNYLKEHHPHYRQPTTPSQKNEGLLLLAGRDPAPSPDPDVNPELEDFSFGRGFYDASGV